VKFKGKLKPAIMMVLCTTLVLSMNVYTTAALIQPNDNSKIAESGINNTPFFGLPLNHTIVELLDYVLVIKDDNSLWGAMGGPSFRLGEAPLGEFFHIWDDAIAISWNFGRPENPELYGGNLYVLQTDGVLLAFEHRGWRRSAPNSALLIPPGINFDAEPTVVLENVRSFETAGSFTYAVTNDNRLWTWGQNEWGQLGDGSTASRLNPYPVMDNVLSAGAGVDRGWAVTNDGGFYIWGFNNYSHYMFLDMDIEKGVDFTFQGAFSAVPTRILNDIIGAFQLGDFVPSTFVIRKDNTLWGWGNNSHGVLGVPVRHGWHQPVKIMDNVATVWSDVFNSVAITNDGEVYSWGFNDRGQLGDLDIVVIQSPQRALTDRIVGASHFAFALDIYGRLYYLGHHTAPPGEVREPILLTDGVMLPVHILP